MDFPAPCQKARCGRGHSRWEQGAETGRQISLAKEWPVPVSERPGFEGIKGQVPSRTGHPSSLVSAWVHRGEDACVHMHTHTHTKKSREIPSVAPMRA